MTRKGYRVLAQFASQYDDSMVDELSKTLSANYANFDKKKFKAHVERLRYESKIDTSSWEPQEPRAE